MKKGFNQMVQHAAINMCKAVVLCIVMLMFCNKASAESITTLDTSYYEPCNFHMELEASTLTINKIPEVFRDGELWFQAVSASTGQKVFDQVYKGNQRISIPLNGYADDTYRIYLYTKTGSNQTNHLQGYWFDEGAPAFKKDGESLEFVFGEYYQQTKAMFDYMLTTEFALDCYRDPLEFVDKDAEMIKEKAVEITKNCTSDYEKVYAIYDWVVKNIAYDYDALKSGKLSAAANAQKVFKNKRAVCQGFAELTAALLRSVDIPAMLTIGNAASPVDATDFNHAWNMVYIDGRWNFLDSTWDNHTGYENGKFDDGSDNENYMFFAMTPEMVSYSHYTLNDWFSVVADYAEYLGIVKDISDVDVDLTYGPVTLELDQDLPQKLGFPEGTSMEYELFHPRGQATLIDNKVYFNGTIAEPENVVYWGPAEQNTDTLMVKGRVIIEDKKFILFVCSYALEDRLDGLVEKDQKQTVTLKKGKKTKFDVQFLNPDAVDYERVIQDLKYTIQYSSSDKEIATVNKQGVVTAKKKGSCVITAKVKVGVRTFTYTLKVKCKG